MDHLLHAEVSARGGGAAIGITRNGECSYAKGYGYANVEWQAPATPETVFPIASISKPLTALAVMMLVEDGSVALDDPIKRYLPALAGSAAPITIAHLLSHTSGLRNFNDERRFYSGPVRPPISVDDLLTTIVQLPCDSAPGARWSYSNSGYVLLSYLIERVSGLSFGSFMRQRLFEPLGMRQSRLMHDRALVPKLAASYQSGPRGLERTDYMSYSWYRGSGALASTIEDLMRLEAGLVSGQVISPDLLARMVEPARLSNGSPYPYGLGWGVSEYIGRPIHHHTGGLAGYRGEYLRLPADGLAVIVLANHADFPFHKVACSLARIALDVPPVEKAEVATSAGARQALAGCFVSPEGAELTIREEGGRLVGTGANPAGLSLDADGNLYNTDDPETTLRLERDGDDTVAAVRLEVPMFAPQRFVREPRGGG